MQSKRQKGNADDENVQQVEAGSHEGVLVEKKSVGHDFDADFHGEDGREDVVEVVENVIARRIGAHRVFGGQHAGRDHDAGEDDVGKDGVIADVVTPHAEFVRRRKDEKG